ncbi:MAG: Ser-Thr-rich GPI-anchored membrane family protein [Patescibacteria group bacterium]
MKNYKKGFAPIIIVLIILILIGAGAYLYIKSKSPSVDTPILSNKLEGITNPKVGDTFSSGQKVDIKWNVNNRKFVIALTNDKSEKTGNEIIRIASITDSSVGHYEYTIPSTPELVKLYGNSGYGFRLLYTDTDGLDFSPIVQVNLKSETTYTPKVDWSKGQIFYENKIIKSVDVPAMLVQKDTVFEGGKSALFKEVIFSPSKTKAAFVVSNGVHDFGWVYDFITSKFIPLTFQYGGGVEIITWKNDSEVTLMLTTPKPESFEKTFNLNNLPEYPKVK